ncbi:MAG: SDR family oxidoreductase [Acidimicrobiia bacterium]|nr:SDR family oxidoreductase [Acidimicrobiia bacterium]
MTPSTELPTTLTGRVALVTGATRGIGRAIAEVLAGAGADVAVVARKADELEETRDALESTGVRATTIEGSVGDPDVCVHAVETCVEQFGGLDILVNNAGTNPHFGPLMDADAGVVAKILDVNVRAPLLLTQEAWRAHMQAHGGVIVNVASVGGLQPSPFIGMYNVSKAALIHMTRQIALEVGPGVRVNALAPGLIKTRMSRALYESDEEGLAAVHPLRRLGLPEDIAHAALFLASDASSWLTGEVLTVDGGMSLGTIPWG